MYSVANICVRFEIGLCGIEKRSDREDNWMEEVMFRWKMGEIEPGRGVKRTLYLF